MAPLGMAQSLRVSFDGGLKADRADGRAEPWAGRGVELVPGRFGKAALVKPGGQLIYAAERNLLSGRGTLACWVRVPARPGPMDTQRLLFVQSKERGYWTYLATMEWEESAFRAMVFDFYHGHGWHDPKGLAAFSAGEWHHVALAWDHARGARFYLDGRPLGSTWGGQAWWERPSPHAIHLCYPGAAYDELCVYDHALTDDDVAALFKANRWQAEGKATAPGPDDRERLRKGLGALGLENLPTVNASAKDGPATVIRQARVREVLDDRIPAWRVVDGRMNLFWPEWRAPTLGDVDYSGSELHIDFEPGQKLTHLVLRGMTGGCKVHGERDGFVSREPVALVPAGRHFLSAHRLPPGLTGLRIPRDEVMKLHEVTALAVEASSAGQAAGPATPLRGVLQATDLSELGNNLLTRTLPEERLILGSGKAAGPRRHAVPALGRLHLVSDPVAEATPLAAVELRLSVQAAWKESVWWLRVQDPVNPRRDLMQVPLRVRNPSPGEAVTVAVVLDFWDVMLDPGARVWIELLPFDGFNALAGEKGGELRLRTGNREDVAREFARTQARLAFSYWQLGSEGDGTRGADPDSPGFALLGHITHNRELKTTLEWVRRHVPDEPLANNLWKITFAKRSPAPVRPRLRPEGAPEWAVWGRELLERFRIMSHHWADRQAPDGQVGGGWNDDTDFPGVFICLPLLGDRKTQDMFTRVFDGLEKTGYLANGMSRSPIDALHATDFLSWRAHLMLFDHGEPRHVERALVLTRELRKWTETDAKGRLRFRTGFYGEGGLSAPQPATHVGDGGLIEETGAGRDSGTNRNFLRDALFAAWYSRNPALLKFVREAAEADLARAREGGKLGAYESYPFYSYFALFGERKYFEGPVEPFLIDRWNLPIWRRYAERLPGGKRLDAQLLQSAAAKSVGEENLAAAYLVNRDRKLLVRAARDACEQLEGGWQFRGGEAGGANDHFYVQGQAALSQMYLGGALTWLRPASILPPIAVSWEGIDADVAALVLEASPQALRVAAYSFDEKPRKVKLRLWELVPGKYRLTQGVDSDQDDRIDGTPSPSDLSVRRATRIELTLPPRRVHVVVLRQVEAKPRPELLPDLALGEGDVFYDKATDRLKAVVHNIGAAAAEKIVVRFEDDAGRLLAERVIPRLDAPLDLVPKTAVVWLGQPLLHATGHIRVRIDPDGRLDEITEENNERRWRR